MADHKLAISFIKKSEGGLSSNQNDNARKNPSPYKNPKTGHFYHTNKGVQWQTFKSLAIELGYNANSPANFLTMPDSIWLKIYKLKYWDPLNLDAYKSQGLANIMVDWSFLSYWDDPLREGIKYVKSKGLFADGKKTLAAAFNTLTAKNEKQTIVDMINIRYAFYRKLKQPANEKGWFARLENLKTDSIKLIGLVTPDQAKAGTFFFSNNNDRTSSLHQQNENSTINQKE